MTATPHGIERGVRLAVVALCGLAVYNALYFFPITVDDAFISLRYAWNLAHGEGFVFNPGERVEGYSNPSWTLLAAGFLLAGIEPLVALKWTGVALVGVLPAVAWASARRLGIGTAWALLPAALCAVDLNIAFWAPNGLEAPLWTVLLAAWPGLLARRWTVGERVPVSALVGAALYVTRPEAPLFIAPAILFEAVLAWRDPSRRKSAFAWAATLAVPCLAWLGFRIAYYGDWVANTFYVKANDGFQPDIFKKYLASWLVVNAPITGALLALAAPLALRTAGGRLAVVTLAIQFLFVLRAGGDWMAQNRFWGPAVPLAAYVVAAGAESLAALLVARAGSFGSARAPRYVGAAVVLALLPQAWRHLTLEFLYLDNGKASVVERWSGNTKRTIDRVRGAFWTGVPDRVARVLEHVPDGATLAHSEIGLLAYVSDNPVLDAFGLVDRRLSGASGEPLADVIESLDPPAYILMREQVPMLTMMTKTGWYAAGGYTERQRWQNVWLVTPAASGPVERLPTEAVFARYDRAVERVPRDITFHLARIELARTVGDKAREARYCAAAAEAIPTLANLCKGGGGPAPKADAIAFRPFVPQTPNLGFEAAVDGKPEGWTPVPGNATDYAAVAEGAAVGTTALRVTGNLWVCSDWAPVVGDLRISGKVRADAITGAKNDRQGAAVNFRVRIRDEKREDYPILKAWTGTTGWEDFALTWPAKPEYTEFRACVGLNNAQGAAWFDEVAAGSADAPADATTAGAAAP